jgi:large subunit ribosomal protein L25
MAQVEVKAQRRTVLGKKVKDLREEGWIPAVIYGPNVDSRSLQIDMFDARELMSDAGGSQLVTVNIEGEEPVQVLIRDFQRDPIRRNLLHIDLYQVDMMQEVTVEVPLIFVGTSDVIEQSEGILIQNMETVEITCLPSELIDAIEVNLAELVEVGDQITVADLAIPSRVQVLSEPDEVVVQIAELEEIPEEEEEEEELFEFLTEADVEPEVIAKGKEEEEVFEEEAFE